LHNPGSLSLSATRKALFIASLLVVILLVFSGVIMPAAMVFRDLLLKATATKSQMFFLAGFSVVAALLIWLAARQQPLALRTFLEILGAIYVFRLAWILLLDPKLTSDFSWYWQLAGQMADQGPSFPFESVHGLRAFPFFYPLALLFGKSAVVFRLANILVIGFASFFVYRFTTRRFDRATAQAAVLLCNLAPETFAAAGIASHDIAGLLFLSLMGLVVLLIDSLITKRSRFLLLLGSSFLLAVTIVLVDIQRVPASVIILSLWIAAAVAVSLQTAPAVLLNRETLASAGKRIVFMAVVPTVLLAVCIPVVHHHLGGKSGLGRSGWVGLAHNHSYTPATWFYYEKVVGPAVSRISPDRLSGISRNLVVSDFADDPGHRLVNIRERAARLLVLGRQVYFYLPNYRQTQLFQRYLEAAAGYRVVAWAVVLVLPFGLVTTLVHRGSNATGEVVTEWPLVFISMFMLALLMIGQQQPRYLFPFYFLAAPWLIGIPKDLVISVRSLGGAKFTAMVGRNLLLFALAVGIGFGGWFTGSLVVNRAYGYEDGRIVNLERLLARRSDGVMLTDGVGMRAKGAGVKFYGSVFGPYEMWVGLQEEKHGQGDVEYRICSLDSNVPWRASLFLQRADFSKEGTIKGNVSLRVESEGDWLDCDLPPDQSLEEFHLEKLRPDPSGCVTITLRLAAAGGSVEPESVKTAYAYRVSLLQLSPDLNGAGAGRQSVE
jgi:hypothetical protein